MSPTTLIPQRRSLPDTPGILPACSHAILVFSPLNGLKAAFSAQPLFEPPLSRMEPSRQFLGRAGRTNVLLLECPADETDLSEILEELSRAGVRSIIACDYAQTLTTHIPPGQVVLAELAVDVDRDVRRLAYPQHELFQRLRTEAARECLSLRRAKILNAHPTDPEYHAKTARRRELDTEVVHRHAFELYADARRLGLAAVFACVICNQAGKDTAPDDIEPVARGVHELQDLLLATLGENRTRLPNCG